VLAMAEIFVHKDGQQLGPFEEGHVRCRIDAGEFVIDDYAWMEGRTSWLPLRELIDLDTSRPPPIAAAHVRAITTPPESSQQASVALWSPVGIVFWSMVLSPLFGTVLITLNWKALTQRKWAWAGCLWIIGISAFGFVIDYLNQPLPEWVLHLSVFEMWFGCFALPHIRYVSRNVGADFRRRSWLRPVSFAVLIAGLMFGVLFVLDLVASHKPDAQSEIPSKEEMEAQIARTDFSPDQIREAFQDYVFEVRCTWKEKGGFLWLSTVERGAQGSAVMLANDEQTGWLLTNRHVIQPPKGAWDLACFVRTTSKPDFIPATVAALRRDGVDLAVLSIGLPPGSKREVLGVLRAAQIREGQSCVAIGNALGGGLSVTSGVVSRLDQVDGLTRIRTSAPVNPGNSGGPLFSTKGAKLIGIVTSGLGAGEAQNINWAIPMDYAIDHAGWTDAHGNRPQLFFDEKR